MVGAFFAMLKISRRQFVEVRSFVLIRNRSLYPEFKADSDYFYFKSVTCLELAWNS